LGKIVVGNCVRVEHSHQHNKLNDRTFTVVLIFTCTDTGSKVEKYLVEAQITPKTSDSYGTIDEDYLKIGVI